MNDEILRKNLVNLREEHEWSQAELARRVGMDNTALNKVEKGTRKLSSSELASIANVFHVSTDYLLGRKEPGNDPVDLDDAIDNAMSFDGRPVTEHDRQMMKQLWKAYIENKD